jgi:hypothetical protein
MLNRSIFWSESIWGDALHHGAHFAAAPVFSPASSGMVLASVERAPLLAQVFLESHDEERFPATAYR